MTWRRLPPFIYARHPQTAFNLDDRDPLYRFITRLTIMGTVAYPKERAGEHFELRFIGDDAPSRYLQTTLKDAQARDEHRSLQYRSYRGAQIPVYKVPPGLGLLEKVRGENRWTAWLDVLPRFLNVMLIMLSMEKM